MSIKVILTGASGMVGEGVLMECLQNPLVSEVLMVNRRMQSVKHPKLKELIITDFLDPANYSEALKGYDACFFCAGISSLGMNEEDYKRITYDTTLHFAGKLLEQNADLTFIYVSGAATDSSEKGKLMWARVKGKTENDLMQMKFKQQYNFRPGLMKPVKGQQNVKRLFKILIPILSPFFSRITLKLEDVAKAMIHVVVRAYPKQILEVQDIKKASANAY